jgi:hypothetical protein
MQRLEGEGVENAAKAPRTEQATRSAPAMAGGCECTEKSVLSRIEPTTTRQSTNPEFCHYLSAPPPQVKPK